MATITLNGREYAPVVARPGTRAVIVLDRGWIFAGDVTRENGRIHITRAVWVFRWERIGFAAVIADPKAEGVDIRPCSDVDAPAGAELFAIPVADDWGA